jgi:hypothetical protein
VIAHKGKGVSLQENRQVITRARVGALFGRPALSFPKKEWRMPRGNNSGIRVQAEDLPVLVAMINRGDWHHDIAARFDPRRRPVVDIF